jgi:hypothetical protein
MIARYGFAEDTHYLRKPFRARDLMLMLRRVLDGQSVANS